MAEIFIDQFITKIPFKMTGKRTDPTNLNYDIRGYHKERIIVGGELREINYYEDFEYSSNTYTNKILTEYRTYNRNPIGIVVNRDMEIHWYCEDDSIGATKVSQKFYSPEEAIQEGIDRRKNMIAFSKTALLRELKEVYGEPLNQQYAFDLLTSVSGQMSYFEQGYTQPLRDALSASTKPYLNDDIKTIIINELIF